MKPEKLEALEDWQSVGKRVLMCNNSNYLFCIRTNGIRYEGNVCARTIMPY